MITFSSAEKVAAARRAHDERARRTGPCRRSRWRRPRARAPRRRASQAPKLWPAEPSAATSIEPSARPSVPCRRAISPDSSPPTARFLFSIGRSSSHPRRPPRWPRGTAAAGPRRSSRRAPGRARARSGAAPPPGTSSGTCSSGRRSIPRAFQWSTASSGTSRSVRPISSSTVRTPSEAMIRARLLGDHEQVVDDVLGLALEAPRSSGSWVATPTGQVLRWQTRIITQPSAISGAVEKPNSSAPRIAPIDHVAARAHLAVDLDHDARAQVVAQQRLLGLGQADLPGDAGVLDRGLGRGAGAAVVAGDHHVVGVGLGHAGRDRAHADLATRASPRCARAGSRSAGRRSAA